MRLSASVLTAVIGVVAGVAATAVALAGPADAAPAVSAAAGTYVPLNPKRVVDTRTGADGNHEGAVAGGHGISPLITGVPTTGVSAVVVTLTAVSPTASGGLTAYAADTTRPGVTNLHFAKGQSVSDLAVVPVAAGRINVYNAASSGTVQIAVDVSGYYAAATSSVTTPGAFHAITPSRVVDTRTGVDGNHKGAVSGGHGIAPSIGGHAGVPASRVSAVIVTLSVVSPARAGSAVAYAAGATRPGESTLHFGAGQSVSQSAVVPVSSTGAIDVVNDSSGAADFVVDVSGYVTSGAPTAIGTFTALRPSRIVSNRHVAASTSTSVRVGGLGGVPFSHVSAVVVTITVLAPTRSGGVEAWRSGSPPGVATVTFATGSTVSDAAIVPMSSTGSIDLRNYTSGGLALDLDVDGYVPATTITPPATSTSRYVRNVAAGSSFVDPGPSGDGCTDARAGSTLVVLDIGAQLSDKDGVALSSVNTSVAYGALVSAVNAYLAGFAACATKAATVAIGTNNDGSDWKQYTATERGTDWANRVIDAVTVPTGAAITVSGADDIEGSFYSTEAEAQGWETAFLKATSSGLVFNGSADGCPSTYGSTTTTCEFGWTLKQYYALAHNGSRVKAAPQIYHAYQAIQWADIDIAGGKAITFAASLTEHGAGCSTECATTAPTGWVLLERAVSTLVSEPSIPSATDLRISS